MMELFWLFIIFSSITPVMRQRMIETRRMSIIRALERQRGSRVVTLIHRQESVALLGIPLSRYIDINDSEQVLRAIKLTPPDMPLDLILHTPGGLVLATEQIATALTRHSGKVTVFIPHYAMSGGTLLALAADEIVMDENAVLGPVDPQIANMAAADILSVVELKGPLGVEDETLMLAEVARKAQRQIKELVIRLTTATGKTYEEAERLADALASGKVTHDYPISYETAKDLGLNVSTEMPSLVYELMSLYPQPPSRRPSVQYIPLPYRSAPRNGE